MVMIFATPGVRAVSSDRSLAGWHGVTPDSLLLEHLAGSSWKCAFVLEMCICISASWETGMESQRGGEMPESWRERSCDEVKESVGFF